MGCTLSRPWNRLPAILWSVDINFCQLVYPRNIFTHLTLCLLYCLLFMYVVLFLTHSSYLAYTVRCQIHALLQLLNCLTFYNWKSKQKLFSGKWRILSSNIIWRTKARLAQFFLYLKEKHMYQLQSFLFCRLNKKKFKLCCLIVMSM